MCKCVCVAKNNLLAVYRTKQYKGKGKERKVKRCSGVTTTRLILNSFKHSISTTTETTLHFFPLLFLPLSSLSLTHPRLTDEVPTQTITIIK